MTYFLRPESSVFLQFQRWFHSTFIDCKSSTCIAPVTASYATAIPKVKFPARSADSVGLAMFALKRMFLVLVFGVVVGRLATGRPMLLDAAVQDQYVAWNLWLLKADLLLIAVYCLPVHSVQGLQCQFHICDQAVTSIPREVLTHHHPHELELLTVRCHGVSRNHPASFA